jgi:hypothetical protein
MTHSTIAALRWSPLLVVLPLSLAGCHPATYGTGEAPEVAMFREMSGGLLNRNQPKKQIEYQPRAPLVLPGNAEQLPPPATTASEATADWPVDRDELKAEADARADDGNPMNDINQAEYHRLKPLAGAFPAQENTSVADDPSKQDYYRTVVHGKEQRQEFARAVADSKGYTRTERKYLTDPPLTYREPVAGTDGSAPPTIEKPKGNFLTRWWHRT